MRPGGPNRNPVGVTGVPKEWNEACRAEKEPRRGGHPRAAASIVIKLNANVTTHSHEHKYSSYFSYDWMKLQVKRMIDEVQQVIYYLTDKKPQYAGNIFYNEFDTYCKDIWRLKENKN